MTADGISMSLGTVAPFDICASLVGSVTWDAFRLSLANLLALLIPILNRGITPLLFPLAQKGRLPG